MKVIESVADWRNARKEFPSGSVGFVPTMGALHQGHATLLRRSREECDISALSIFVNPTQFNDPQDLMKYPRTLERDLEVALGERVDYVFLPDAPLIVRADIEQSRARFVQPGMRVTIRDHDPSNDQAWEGEVVSLSRWVIRPRTIL